jgi:hypothetical protein
MSGALRPICPASEARYAPQANRLVRYMRFGPRFTSELVDRWLSERRMFASNGHKARQCRDYFRGAERTAISQD